VRGKRSKNEDKILKDLSKPAIEVEQKNSQDSAFSNFKKK